MKLKLAFALFKYFPYGGLQRDFFRIAKACVARGHDVHVYTHAWEGAPPESQFQLHLLNTRHCLQNHTRNRVFAAKLKSELKREQYDLVIGFNKMPHLDVYYAADICYQARMDQQSIMEAFAPARSAVRFLYHLLPRYQQHLAMEKAVFARGQHTEIMLIAHHQQQIFQSYYQTEDTRFHLLPPGIAKEPIISLNANEARAITRHTYHLDQDHLLLLMIGSGFKTKGVDRAIRALATLPDAERKRSRLFVIGQDEPQPFLHLAKKLHLQDQVFFLGGRADVANFLYAADVLLHPAYHENTGTVLLEALVAGLPVLTVENCGYAFHVKRANAGVVLKCPFEQVVMNQVLEKMLLSDRRHFRENAALYADTVDLYSMPEKATAIIEDMANRSRNNI